MYISRLSLYGFKSFLKKSEVEFGRGITSVVGPNGCGKTNIVDAIRWVIGEQKSSVLRADRSTDVIFNGTSTRRPLNLAEVSLTIHNVSGRVPIQYSDITITRRVYRNGESEYFINKHLCRLKDITDLFIDTGMGANAYSIIELKMIEDILSETPEERKRLFEEAAGVNKYRVQRKAALKKLDATRNDLLRLNDIILEVDSKVKALHRQLKRYEKYKEVSQQLIDTEVLLAARRVFDIRLKEQPLEDELASRRTRLEAVSKEIDVKEKAWNQDQELFEHNEGILQEKIQNLDQIKTNFNQLQTRQSVLREQQRNIEQTILRLQKEAEDLDVNALRLRDRKQKLEAEQAEYQTQIKAKKAGFEGLSTEQEKVDSGFNAISAEIQSLQDQRYALVREQAEYTAKYNSQKENIAQREKELLSLKEQIDRIVTAEAQIKGSVEAKKNDVDLLKNGLEETYAGESRSEEKYEQLFNREKEVNQTLRKIESELDKINNKIQFYSSIIQSKEGYSPALQHILEHAVEFPGILGALSDQIAVESGYQLAVQAVLKDISRLLLASDRLAALETVTKLESIGKGSVAILPLDFSIHDASGPNPGNSKLQPLARFVKCKENLRPVRDLLFRDVFICEDEDFRELLNEPALDSVTIVSKRGKLRDAAGILSGGAESSESGILVGRAEMLNRFEVEFDELQRERDGIGSELAQIREDMQGIVRQRKDLEQRRRDLQNRIRQQEEALRSGEAKLIEYQSILKTLNENRLTVKVALENFRQKSKKEDPQNSAVNAKIEELDQKIERRKNELAQAKITLDQINQRVQNERLEFVNLENRYRNAVDELYATEQSIRSQGTRSQTSIREKEAGLEKQKEIGVNQEQINLDLEKTRHALNAAGEEVADLRSAHQKLRARIQLLNEELFKLRHEKELLSGDISRLELEKSEFTGQEKEIRSVLMEKYERTIPGEYPDELPDAEELTRKIARFKKNLEEIGMVNMAVRDEYEQELSRLKFLEDQRNDLVESEKGLNEVIEQIDDIARKQYVEVFNKIRENFKKTFSIFFDGGDSEIQMVGDSDPLEANIEIWACPSGKKMRSLKMLSAGEKALTAIALLFGIYQVKPSPFCILDEVDAPLDDQNTKRFTNVIRTFSQNTQFIIVTHNKVTMSIADSLYGVTMAESGVSQIVSARLE